MAVPIWKDYFVELSSGDSIQYRIVLDGTNEVIYSGKAYKRPGDSSISVRINDVCADYLQNVLPTLSQAEFSALDLPLTFNVQAYSSTWTTIESVQFLNDWSYDYDYDAATMGMSFPINGRIDARMPIVWTGLDVSQVTATINLEGGISFPVYIPVEISADFNDDFNQDFARSARSASSGTAVFYPSTWDNVESITIGNNTWQIVTDCARYALYYVNPYGGWESFLIEGNFLESDAVRRYTRDVVYDNRDVQNRGRQNYLNEITKAFTFHTGWLSDIQSSRMAHLINSTEVYMYDISAGQMIPVILTTNTCDYKTFSNQGNKLVNYTIQVEIAQSRIRR